MNWLLKDNLTYLVLTDKKAVIRALDNKLTVYEIVEGGRVPTLKPVDIKKGTEVTTTIVVDATLEGKVV